MKLHINIESKLEASFSGDSISLVGRMSVTGHQSSGSLRHQHDHSIMKQGKCSGNMYCRQEKGNVYI